MIKKLTKSKKFPIIVIFATVLVIILLLIIKSLITGVTVGTYGNRLKGIKDVPFNSNSQKKVSTALSSNEKVDSVNIKIKGKIINIKFNVSDDVSVDDAKNIANESLNNISGKVKKFYDIQVFITKKTEKGTTQEVQTTEGNTKVETVKDFPIIGYKNSNKEGFTW